MTRPDTFERIVALLNDAMLDDTRWPEASTLIDEVCGTKGSALIFGADLPANDVQIFLAKCYARGEDRSAEIQEYFRLYHPIDEHLPRVRQLPDSKIVSVVDLFSESELRTSLAYNEGYASYGIQNGLSVRLDGPRGSRIVWSIKDPVDADGWTSARTKMIARVLPHLRQYVRVRSALEEADAFGASVIELLDHPGLGVIQLDQRGQIVATNDSAREVLRGNDGLSDEDGQLQAAWPEDRSRLQDLLARALPRFGQQGASGSMTVAATVVAAEVRIAREPAGWSRGGRSITTGGCTRADRRPCEAGTDPTVVRGGGAEAHADGGRDRGATRGRPDRPRDRGGDRSRIHHRADAPQAHLRQARLLAADRCRAGRPGIVEPADVPGLARYASGCLCCAATTCASSSRTCRGIRSARSRCSNRCTAGVGRRKTESRERQANCCQRSW